VEVLRRERVKWRRGNARGVRIGRYLSRRIGGIFVWQSSLPNRKRISQRSARSAGPCSCCCSSAFSVVLLVSS
jgi:hypothetical protein